MDIIADIFMTKLEGNKLKSAVSNLCHCYRYANDIFSTTERNGRTDGVVRKFNEAHTTIQTSAELEKDNNLLFLYVDLTRRPDGLVQKKVHKKATWNGQYKNFYSIVPMHQKRNPIKCLTS